MANRQLPSANSHPPIFIAGPTATGKSAIALALAEQLGGEIISVDSMQVYRGLDVGTAKPGAAERGKIPHHLIDICDLTEAFDAAQFIRRAQTAVDEIQSRKKIPIFCGGTGLYFNAWLSGLGEAPSANPELRAELETLPFEKLLQELRERDQDAYEKIDKQNPRRVIRAVEVIRLTGKKFSEQKARWGETPGEPDSAKEKQGSRGRSPHQKIFALTRQQSDLHARINARVEEMFRRGLVDETRELLKRGLEQNKTAMQAIGYRQVVEHLRGERDLAETIELVKTKTRQFAKRQLTWFRRQLQPEWIELPPGELPEESARKICAAV
ncbi:MAG TPA: tRNA (adenosine(37)-N6)-dimethylallyltransferase MiaA [Verrucomicrobiae bacterium]|nr:tRNA (adenosine(37)-N6)-dimethylallyltransferase MiaA [Verrucomicrobiae bacterium]